MSVDFRIRQHKAIFPVYDWLMSESNCKSTVFETLVMKSVIYFVLEVYSRWLLLLDRLSVITVH